MDTLRVAVYVRIERQVLLRQFMIMRWLLSFLVLALVAVVRAASFTGNRLLVVLDEQAEREKYSVFLDDLEGKCFLSRLRQLRRFCQINETLESSNCTRLTVELYQSQPESASNIAFR